MAKETILVVDDERRIRDLLNDILKLYGYKVITAATGQEAIDVAMHELPNIILLDVLIPDINGYEVCKVLRGNEFTCMIPIIFLTVKDSTEDKVRGLQSGASDYITKPFEVTEIIARIEGVLRRSKMIIEASPLTGLPGNISIEKEICRRLDRPEEFAVIGIDIDNFKSFNDKYGYAKGDEVIKILANIIIDSLQVFGYPDDFVGHLGGDDFIIVCSQERAHLIGCQIIKRFDKIILYQYDLEDRERGFIESIDRQGRQMIFPLMSLSVYCVFRRPGKNLHYGVICKKLSELKTQAKSKQGSVWMLDRRHE